MTDRDRDPNTPDDTTRASPAGRTRSVAEHNGDTAPLNEPEVIPDTRTTLSLRQWHALDTVLAEMCERTHGALEDLHDRGRGILENCRPGTRHTAPHTRSDTTAPLWKHVHRVVGALAHLEDAAPDDTRAIHEVSKDVYALADRLAAHPAEPAT